MIRSIAVSTGVATLWVASFYPAWLMKSALILGITPLAAMMCDNPNLSCPRILLSLYGLGLALLIEGAVFFTALVSGKVRYSWKTALASNCLNWLLVAIFSSH